MPKRATVDIDALLPLKPTLYLILLALTDGNRHRQLTAHHLTTFIDTLTQLRDGLLQDEEGLGVEALVVEGANQYQEWEGHRLANRWEQSESDHLPQGGMMSQMGGMLLGRFGRRGEDNDE